MRFGYGLALAALLATPVMAQELVIKPPNPGAAAQAQGAASQARTDARQELNAARRDQRQENRDLATGNYLGAAQAEQRERSDLGAATRDARQSNRDANAARRDDSWKLGVAPR